MRDPEYDIQYYVSDSEAEAVFEFELPGTKKEDIKVDVKNGYMVLKAKVSYLIELHQENDEPKTDDEPQHGDATETDNKPETDIATETDDDESETDDDESETYDFEIEEKSYDYSQFNTYHKFHLKMHLPSHIDATNIEYKCYKNGILILVAPFNKTHSPRALKID